MFAKKLFFLSDNHLSAWQWRSGKLAKAGDFQADSEGLAGFAEYLAKSPNTPIHLLVDVIEEDFRIETIPHILGKDRKTLIQRKLNQLLRGTPYRHASLQGRETEGRRDDKLLLTGLTNEELLKPWVERIAQHKLPLAGIYSLPLLSQVLVKKLGLVAPHQLLITRHKGGLRQSYFQEGLLKFSRLTLLSAEDMDAMQGAVSREASRTQQYLNSLRLLPRDQALEIVMICGDSYFHQIQPESMNTPTMHYRTLDMAAVAAQLGLKATAAELTSERLFLYLLGRYTPPQHYAPREQLWHNQLRLVRSGILGTTVTTIAIGAYFATANFELALDDYHRSEKLGRETRELQAQYQAIKNTFPPTPATPEQMKSAVELVERANSKNITPEPLLGLISQALETSPSVKLNQIKWLVSEQPNQGTSPNQQTDANGGTPGMLLGIGKPYQIVVFDGEIVPFTDYRSTLDSLALFVDKLRKQPSLQVTPLTMPIDIGSQYSLKGSAGKKMQDKASFSLKLILSPSP